MAAKKEIEDDGQDAWLMEYMEKEERLARMETRRKAWEAEYICKEVLEDIMVAVSRSGNEQKVRNILDMVMDTAIQESRIKAILADIKEYSLESIVMEAMMKEERMTKMVRRQRMWETKHICKETLEEVLGTVRSESEVTVTGMVNDILEAVVQGSTMEYDLEIAFMMEMDWSQEYDWIRTEGLAEILKRMEISACMMDTLSWGCPQA